MLAITCSRVQFQLAAGFPRCVMCSWGLSGCGFVIQVTLTSDMIFSLKTVSSGFAPGSHGQISFHVSIPKSAAPLIWVVLRSEQISVPEYISDVDEAGIGEDALLQKADARRVPRRLEPCGYGLDQPLARVRMQREIAQGQAVLSAKGLHG